MLGSLGFKTKIIAKLSKITIFDIFPSHQLPCSAILVCHSICARKIRKRKKCHSLLAHRCISIYAIDPWSSMRFHNSHGRSMHPDTTIQTSGFNKPSLGRVCSRGVCWTSMKHLCFFVEGVAQHTHQVHPDRMRVGIQHQLFKYRWDRKCYGTTTGFELHL